MESPNIWFITGCSSGFGYRLARIALRRGDKVIATARSLARMQRLVEETDEDERDRLKILKLDIDEKMDVIKAVVDEAASVWGRIDVLVNNAGWGRPSLTEETESAGIQEQLLSNVMGCVNVTFAVLPYMRRQKSGTIVTIGSRSAWRAELPGIGTYAMVKAAIHAFTESLMKELVPCNIRVLLVEPGSFRTEGIYRHGFNNSNPIPDYDELRAKTEAVFRSIPGNEPGNPDKGMEVVVDIVRGEGVAAGRPWPYYLPLGTDADRDIRAKCSTMLNVLDDWQDVVKGVAWGPA